MRHPITGQDFDSPVPAGTGWPGDPADATTPVAHTAPDVERLAATGSVHDLDARSSVCRACPRLVEWREQVASGLESLGWSSRDAAAAVERVVPLRDAEPDLGIGELMRAALKTLAR